MLQCDPDWFLCCFFCLLWILSKSKSAFHCAQNLLKDFHFTQSKAKGLPMGQSINCFLSLPLLLLITSNLFLLHWAFTTLASQLYCPSGRTFLPPVFARAIPFAPYTLLAISCIVCFLTPFNYLLKWSLSFLYQSLKTVTYHQNSSGISLYSTDHFLFHSLLNLLCLLLLTHFVYWRNVFQPLEKDLLGGKLTINISWINEQRIILKDIFRKEKGK